MEFSTPLQRSHDDHGGGVTCVTSVTYKTAHPKERKGGGAAVWMIVFFFGGRMVAVVLRCARV